MRCAPQLLAAAVVLLALACGAGQAAALCRDCAARFTGSQALRSIGVPWSTSAITVMYWLYFDAASSTTCHVSATTTGGSTSVQTDHFLLCGTSSLKLSVRGSTYTFNPNIPVNSWAHISVTWGNLVGQAQLRVNGTSIGTSSSLAIGASMASAVSLSIGADEDSYGGTFASGSYFSGLIDELAVFSTQLSSGTIDAIRASGVSATASNLLFVLRMDNCDSASTTIVSDGPNRAAFTAAAGTPLFVPSFRAYASLDDPAANPALSLTAPTTLRIAGTRFDAMRSLQPTVTLTVDGVDATFLSGASNDTSLAFALPAPSALPSVAARPAWLDTVDVHADLAFGLASCNYSLALHYGGRISAITPSAPTLSFADTATITLHGAFAASDASAPADVLYVAYAAARVNATVIAATAAAVVARIQPAVQVAAAAGLSESALFGTATAPASASVSLDVVVVSRTFGNASAADPASGATRIALTPTPVAIFSVTPARCYVARNCTLFLAGRGLSTSLIAASLGAVDVLSAAALVPLAAAANGTWLAVALNASRQPAAVPSTAPYAVQLNVSGSPSGARLDSALTVFDCALPAQSVFNATLSEDVCACPPGRKLAMDGSACLPCGVGAFAATWNVTACAVCSAGSFAGTPTATACDVCAAGTFAAASNASVCAACAAGYYAASADATACDRCAAGAFSSAVSATACDLCPPGAFSAANSSACSLCAAGSFGPAANSTACSPCSAGTFAAASNATVCAQCAAGTYAAAAAASVCDICHAGAFSSASSTACSVCAAGAFSSAASATACDLCPPGAFSAANSSACSLCAAGSFGPAANSTACSLCSAGSFSAAWNATVCAQCAAGTYSASAATVCAACPAGSFVVASLSSCSVCPAGAFSATSSRSACDACPAGAFSAANATACSLCAAGSFGPAANSTACSPCSAGSFSAASNATVCAQCAAGTSSASAATVCDTCLAGSFSSSSSSTACRLCAAGSFSPASTATACDVCPPGAFSSSNASTCSLCAAGSFGAASNASACSACAAGAFASAPNATACSQCPAGTHSSAAATRCDACPAGSFSDAAASSCTECPAGSFGATSSLSACDVCPAGAFSAASASLCTLCAPGSFGAVANATACTPCAIGEFASAANATVCARCAAGTFAAATSASVCDACPAGSFGAAGASLCAACPAGSFGSAPSAAACDVCPAGAFSSSNSSTCTLCAPGSFGAVANASTCSACATGSFAPAANATACQPCSAGAYAAAASASVCDACPAGAFSAAVAASACAACPPGSYAAASNATACRLCPPGTFSAAPAASVCSICAANTFASASNTTHCSICPDGTSSPPNATNCTACADPAACLHCSAGSYIAPNATACAQCAAGTYSLDAETACTNCSAGSYGPSAAASSCTLCPAGAFSATAARTACTSCAAGTAAAASGRTRCTACDPGSFASSAAAANCSVCPAGAFSSAAAATACAACPPGSFAAASNATACDACAPGAYAAATRSSACSVCAPGTFAPASTATACISCAAGAFAAASNSTACSLCPPGARSAAASASTACSNCSAGSFSLGAVSACSACAAGAFAAAAAATACFHCSPGYAAAAAAATACAICTPGYYAAAAAATVCTACAAGSFNASLAATSCAPCSAGTSTAAATAATACTNCTAGYYAPAPLTPACLPCARGMYNTANASSACAACAAGHDSRLAATRCDNCTVGRFANHSATPSCPLCPAGSFGAAIAATACSLCPVQQYTPSAGRTACSTCPDGFRASTNGSDHCTAPSFAVTRVGPTVCTQALCSLFVDGDGFYNDTIIQFGTNFSLFASSSNCSLVSITRIQCLLRRIPINGYVNITVANGADARKTLFEPVYFTDDCPEPGQFGRGIDCVPCPEGAVCPGGYRLWPLPGWWSAGETSGIVERCTSPSACLGGRFSTCREGNEGYLCASCSALYYASNGVCRQCSEPSARSTLLFIMIACMAMLVVACTFASDSLIGAIEFAVFCVQVIWSTCATAGAYLPEPLQSVLSQLSLFAGDISFVQPECFNPDELQGFSLLFFVNVALLVGSIVPFIGLCALGVYLRLVVLRRRALRRGMPLSEPFTNLFKLEMRVRLLRGVIVLVAFGFYNLAVLGWNALFCRPDGNGEWRLAIDPLQVCGHGTHAYMIAVAVAVQCMLVVVPVFAFVFLFRVRRKIRAELSRFDKFTGRMIRTARLLQLSASAAGAPLGIDDDVDVDDDGDYDANDGYGGDAERRAGGYGRLYSPSVDADSDTGSRAFSFTNVDGMTRVSSGVLGAGTGLASPDDSAPVSPPDSVPTSPPDSAPVSARNSSDAPQRFSLLSWAAKLGVAQVGSSGALGVAQSPPRSARDGERSSPRIEPRTSPRKSRVPSLLRVQVDTLQSATALSLAGVAPMSLMLGSAGAAPRARSPSVSVSPSRVPHSKRRASTNAEATHKLAWGGDESARNRSARRGSPSPSPLLAAASPVHRGRTTPVFSASSVMRTSDQEQDQQQQQQRVQRSLDATFRATADASASAASARRGSPAAQRALLDLVNAARAPADGALATPEHKQARAAESARRSSPSSRRADSRDSLSDSPGLHSFSSQSSSPNSDSRASQTARAATQANSSRSAARRSSPTTGSAWSESIAPTELTERPSAGELIRRPTPQRAAGSATLSPESHRVSASTSATLSPLSMHATGSSNSAMRSPSSAALSPTPLHAGPASMRSASPASRARLDAAFGSQSPAEAASAAGAAAAATTTSPSASVDSSSPNQSRPRRNKVRWSPSTSPPRESFDRLQAAVSPVVQIALTPVTHEHASPLALEPAMWHDNEHPDRIALGTGADNGHSAPDLRHLDERPTSSVFEHTLRAALEQARLEQEAEEQARRGRFRRRQSRRGASGKSRVALVVETVPTASPTASTPPRAPSPGLSPHATSRSPLVSFASAERGADFLGPDTPGSASPFLSPSARSHSPLLGARSQSPLGSGESPQPSGRSRSPLPSERSHSPLFTAGSHSPLPSALAVDVPLLGDVAQHLREEECETHEDVKALDVALGHIAHHVKSRAANGDALLGDDDVHLLRTRRRNEIEEELPPGTRLVFAYLADDFRENTFWFGALNFLLDWLFALSSVFLNAYTVITFVYNAIVLAAMLGIVAGMKPFTTQVRNAAYLVLLIVSLLGALVSLLADPNVYGPGDLLTGLSYVLLGSLGLFLVAVIAMFFNGFPCLKKYFRPIPSLPCPARCCRRCRRRRAEFSSAPSSPGSSLARVSTEELVTQLDSATQLRPSPAPPPPSSPDLLRDAPSSPSAPPALHSQALPHTASSESIRTAAS